MIARLQAQDVQQQEKITQAILPEFHRQRVKPMNLTQVASQSIRSANRMKAFIIHAGRHQRQLRCLVLLVATNSLLLSAGMLELPLYFSYASPDNVLGLPLSHRVVIAGGSMALSSRLSYELSGSGQYLKSGQVDTSLCIEPYTPGLSPETGIPCLPLPESSENMFLSITDGRPGRQQAVRFLPVNKVVFSTNEALSCSGENTCVLPQPCDQEPCIAWDYRGQISVLDLSETVLPERTDADETKVLTPWVVVQSVDQNGNIIYQWYDEEGHLHTIGEWEYKRWLSMYFQSLLEFLYPEFFGPSLPAGGGWHKWKYWTVRRTADRPGNTGQQRWPARRGQHQFHGKAVRSVATVQPVQQARFTKPQPRHQKGRPQPSPSGRASGRVVKNEIDTLLKEFESGDMQDIAARYDKRYNGKKHGQYCSKIKRATRDRQKPLTDDEKQRFVPFMRHLSDVVYSFNGISLNTCVHSLVASQLLYPPRSTQGQRPAFDGEGASVKEAQKALIKEFLTEVECRAKLQKRAPYGFNAQEIANLLWALAKLVENGQLQRDQGDLASQAVTALLPQVVTPPEPFISQHISNLLWALAKLVENGRLQPDQGGLASQAVMALLPQVVAPPEPFISQHISNLLWALAKLVENGRLPLDQGGLARQAVTALLPQVQSHQDDFTSQGVSNLLWALAKLVENGRLQLDQGGLARQAVTALLPQVQSHQDDFTSQGVSTLLWALAKLVENGRLQLDQGGLARQAVTALLSKVVISPGSFISQHISNLLWALAKLVESGLLPLDQGGLTRQAVTALLPQVVNPPEPFKPQQLSNLLWALAKLVENGLLQLDQAGLTSQAVTELLPQVQSHQDDFTSQGVSNLLWALAKLVENGRLQLDQGGLASQAMTALLPKVVIPPRPFKPQEISNLLWALAKLVENGLLPLDQGGLASQAVMALLPQVQSHQDDFTSQEVSNLLWALAKLVENGRLQRDQAGLASQAVTVLLPRVVKPPGPFISQHISNQLWALAKLVENGLLQLSQDGLASQAVTKLLPQVQSHRNDFTSQGVSNLLWALAKLVENGRLMRDQAGLASQAVTALLPKVQRHQDDFTSQGVSNLLWALAKLVENGWLPLNRGGLASQAVTELLPHVVKPPGPFISQHISNLLWALAKLVESGLLQLDQGGLASQAVTALLPQVVKPPGSFIPQHISNLLWALAKLVENGLLQLDQGGLTSQAVTALLPQVATPSGPFISQHISNLLWALAKLVESGLLQLNQSGLASQAVTALLPQVVKPPGPFISQHISNLLWALAALGDGVSLDEIFNILITMNINTIESWRDQEITLWALTVFLARGGEKGPLLSPMKRLYKALIAEEKNNSDIRATIIRQSGIWLGKSLSDLPVPNYKTTVSHPHRELHRILRERFPRYALEKEASIDGLPPVDLLFPRKKVVVEVQGPYHYVDKGKKLRNGSTILKISTYEKLGYKVFEIPVSDVANAEKQEQLLSELDAYFLNGGNSADKSTESDYKTAEEDGWYSAEDKP